MNFIEIIAAIFIALVIGALFYFGFRKTGPWGSFWSFLLIMFLGIWALSLWTEPVGPVYWDVAWLPLIFIGLLIALLLAAASPPYSPTEEPVPDERAKRLREEDEVAAGGVVAIGLFFWLVVLLFVIAIVVALATV